MPDIDFRGKWPAVADVIRYGFFRLAGSIDEPDLTGAAPRYRSKRNGASDFPGSDDAEFHEIRNAQTGAPEDLQGIYSFAAGPVSDLTPSRLAAINKLKLDRRNSEECDHGRLLRIVLHAVVMRGVGNAPDEAARRNSNSIFRIEIRPAIHPPCAGQNKREPISSVGMWGAHVTWEPLHQY